MKKNEERIKLTCQFLNEGKKLIDIAEILNISRQSVYNIIKLYLKKNKPEKDVYQIK